MTLKDSIQSDVNDIFLNTDEYAETITYYFEGGGSVSIPAIVDREPPAFYDVAGNVVLPAFTIAIGNKSESVTRSQVDTGGDEVGLKAKFGDLTDTRLAVLKVLGQDYGGMMKLALK